MNEQHFAEAVDAIKYDVEIPLSYIEETGSIVDRSGKEILRLEKGSYVDEYFVDTARSEIHKALVEIVIKKLSEELS